MCGIIKIIENIGVLFSSLLTTSLGVLSQKPLYDEFVGQLSDEDLKIIEAKVTELKRSRTTTPTEIELTNNKRITIVVV